MSTATLYVDRSCSECGSSEATHPTHHAGRLCDDLKACTRRVAEQAKVAKPQTGSAISEAEYLRMQLAVIAADEMHTKLTEALAAAKARIEEQKKAHAERKRMIDEARAVLDDCFASGEARSTAHALEALRRIICGTGLAAFGQPAATAVYHSRPHSDVFVPDQPAAPECNYVGRCNSSRCPVHGQPAAPTRTVWVNGETRVPLEALTKLLAKQGVHVAPTRTEADQAVLDAAAAIHPRALKRPLSYTGDWEEFVDAELARRGLKP